MTRKSSALFKRFVRRVVIETSAYCNRRCVFCPNADGNRLVKKRELPREDFEAIIDDLAEIGFTGPVLFHLFNEPLANPDIFDQIAYARQRLPESVLSFNSNGDYIRKDTIRRLLEAGLTTLNVSIYGPAHGRFERDYVAERVAEMAETCGLPKRFRWVSDIDCRAVGNAEHEGRSMRIFIQARDLNVMGYDRGGTIQFTEQELPVRMTPCIAPFDEVLVTWNGVAVPCCNIIGDKPDHAPYTAGKVSGKGSIFAVYAAGPLVKWRRSMLPFAKHGGPCEHCTRIMEPIAALGPEHHAFNAAAEQLLNASEVV